MFQSKGIKEEPYPSQRYVSRDSFWIGVGGNSNVWHVNSIFTPNIKATSGRAGASSSSFAPLLDPLSPWLQLCSTVLIIKATAEASVWTKALAEMTPMRHHDGRF